MDKRKKYIAVIDTETVGDTKHPNVYDLGVTITDKKGNIYHQANWIVKEIFQQKERMQSAYYSNKLPKYYKMLESGQAIEKEWLSIREEFNQIMEDYNVSVISAYNLKFDINAMACTHKDLGNKGKFLIKNFEIWDIWGMATQTILRQKTFQKIAIRENWKTAKGNVLTNAEVAYRYITNKLGFIESHTALHDTEIETQIMVKCLRQHKKMKKGLLENPWKFAQPKYI